MLVIFSPSPLVQPAQKLVLTAAWPILKAADLVRGRAVGTARFFADQRFLRMQNDQFAKQVEELTKDQAALGQMRLENERLRKLLDFKTAQRPSVLAARVMGYDPSEWTQSVLIDKGTEQGVDVNQAVVCPAGVAGKIIQVNKFCSKVLLLVDSHIRIGAMLENSRDTGILEGQSQRRCRILYLPKDTVVELGQRVWTSGLGGIFPKGLLIGRVVGVGLDELGLYQFADVEPAVNVSRLEEVLVLTEDNKKPNRMRNE